MFLFYWGLVDLPELSLSVAPAPNIEHLPYISRRALR